eukprot:COSAG05_NODE_280_length_12288_cov_4.797933_20_plen_147_part_00
MAGGAECYPFKSERVQLEQVNVIMAVAGVLIACGLISTSYGNENLANDGGARLRLGLCAACAGLISFGSAWAIKDARQPSNAQEAVGFLASIREALDMDAFYFYCIASFADSVSNNVISGFFVFYLTYVSRLTQKEIAFNIVAVYP